MRVVRLRNIFIIGAVLLGIKSYMSYLLRSPPHATFTTWVWNADTATQHVSNLSYQQLQTERKRLLRLCRKGINPIEVEKRLHRVEQRIDTISTGGEESSSGTNPEAVDR